MTTDKKSIPQKKRFIYLNDFKLISISVKCTSWKKSDEIVENQDIKNKRKFVKQKIVIV